MQHHRRRRQRSAIAPEERARSGVNRKHLIAGRRDEHDAVDDHRRRLVAILRSGREDPCGLKALDVVCVDLAERAVAPAVIGAADHRPIGVGRILQAIGRNRLILLQDRRHRRRLKQCCARCGRSRQLCRRGSLRRGLLRPQHQCRCGHHGTGCDDATPVTTSSPSVLLAEQTGMVDLTLSYWGLDGWTLDSGLWTLDSRARTKSPEPRAQSPRATLTSCCA